MPLYFFFLLFAFSYSILFFFFFLFLRLIQKIIITKPKKYKKKRVADRQTDIQPFRQTINFKRPLVWLNTITICFVLCFFFFRFVFYFALLTTFFIACWTTNTKTTTTTTLTTTTKHRNNNPIFGKTKRNVLRRLSFIFLSICKIWKWKRRKRINIIKCTFSLNIS